MQNISRNIRLGVSFHRRLDWLKFSLIISLLLIASCDNTDSKEKSYNAVLFEGTISNMALAEAVHASCESEWRNLERELDQYRLKPHIWIEKEKYINQRSREFDRLVSDGAKGGVEEIEKELRDYMGLHIAKRLSEQHGIGVVSIDVIVNEREEALKAMSRMISEENSQKNISLFWDLSIKYEREVSRDIKNNPRFCLESYRGAEYTKYTHIVNQIRKRFI